MSSEDIPTIRDFVPLNPILIQHPFRLYDKIDIRDLSRIINESDEKFVLYPDPFIMSLINQSGEKDEVDSSNA